jgi:hypothetical protein
MTDSIKFDWISDNEVTLKKEPDLESVVDSIYWISALDWEPDYFIELNFH